MTEQRFLQIQETLKQHKASYRTDCDEADDYRKDMLEMIIYVSELKVENETLFRLIDRFQNRIIKEDSSLKACENLVNSCNEQSNRATITS